MSRFYFFLWLRWVVRVTLSTLIIASALSFIVTIFIYFKQGSAELSYEVINAVWSVFKFWFPISVSVALLIALFRSLKHIFNYCINGYELKLLECSSNVPKGENADFIEVVGYGDLVKVWRKWFMLIIWLVGSMMIISLALTYLFSSYKSVFEWFNIFWLFGFILISAYFSFIIMIARCKRVKVIKC